MKKEITKAVENSNKLNNSNMKNQVEKMTRAELKAVKETTIKSMTMKAQVMNVESNQCTISEQEWRFCLLTNNRKIDDRRVVEFTQLIHADKYDATQSIVTIKAEELVGKCDLIDLEGNSIEKDSAKEYLVVLDGQHRVSAFSRLNETFTEPSFTFSQKSIEFNNAGGEQSLELKSSKDWVASSADWLTMSPSLGREGTTILAIIAKPNETNEDRTASIEFISETLRESITVFQKKKNAILITQDFYSIKSEGDVISVEVKSNIDFKVIIPDDAQSWVTQSKARNLTTHHLQFLIAKNTQAEKRVAEIVFEDTASSLKEILTIEQDKSASNKIHVEHAGSLGELIGAQKESIKELTLTGSLNGSDIRIIREMKSLTILNMKDASIVEGGGWYNYTTLHSTTGEVYYHYLYTVDNIISLRMFNRLGTLKSITLPKDITEISDYAFADCSTLETVNISEGVKIIHAHVFNGCKSLKNITIPNSVTQIGDYAFINATSLVSIVIPNSVTKLGRSVFWNCTLLSNVTLSENITSIGKEAFYHCNSLKTITVPQNVSLIGEFAFAQCPILKEIHIKALTPPIANLAFNNQAEKLLFVPKGTLKTYKETEEWNRFTDIREE